MEKTDTLIKNLFFRARYKMANKTDNTKKRINRVKYVYIYIGVMIKLNLLGNNIGKVKMTMQEMT
jgi:hypothetical protein